MLLLLGSFVDAPLALWPQPPHVVGYWLLGAELAAWAGALAFTFTGPRAPREHAGSTMFSAVLSHVAFLAPIDGAAAIVAQAPGADLTAIAVGILMSMFLAFFNSWVFWLRSYANSTSKRLAREHETGALRLKI